MSHSVLIGHAVCLVLKVRVVPRAAALALGARRVPGANYHDGAARGEDGSKGAGAAAGAAAGAGLFKPGRLSEADLAEASLQGGRAPPPVPKLAALDVARQQRAVAARGGGGAAWGGVAPVMVLRGRGGAAGHDAAAARAARVRDVLLGGDGVSAAPPPPPSRTNWTRLAPPPVLTGHGDAAGQVSAAPGATAVLREVGAVDGIGGARLGELSAQVPPFPRPASPALPPAQCARAAGCRPGLCSE